MPKGFPQGDRSAATLAAQRRRAAEEHLSEFEAFAQLVVDLIGIDTIRARLGRERALKLIRLAGGDAERIAGNWERSEPMRRQVSVGSPGAGYDRDPDHDPRVTKLILSGAPFSEINAMRKLVTDELRAHPPPTVGPPGVYRDEAPDAGGELGVSYETVRAPDGRLIRRPVQRSTNYASWETLHAQDPAAVTHGLAPGPGQPGPAPVNGHPAGYWAGPAGSVTECSHEAQDGHKFCSACGARRSAPPAQAAAPVTQEERHERHD